MQQNQSIFESVFNRPFSDQGNKNFLKEYTVTHPYFSPAQFYLLHKLDPDTDAFKEQAAKTNILFNNPFWLNFQLKQTNQRTTFQEEKNSIPSVADETGNTGYDETEFTEAEAEIEPIKIELKIPDVNNMDEAAMVFEPMHLVDYFASQGIKLSEEVQPADKLGKQLKSFTEWLKTMKKVHTETEGVSNVHTDTAIQNLAEKSNIEDDVLTVSMADVFAKQGKLDKARDIFEKLSLLNPAKSAYFAAKIDNLKES